METHSSIKGTTLTVPFQSEAVKRQISKAGNIS
jgi:hypothetical protein